MAAFPNGIIYFGSLCRQLVSYFDGETNDTTGCTEGPIGQAIKNLEKRQGPFVQFTPVPNNLPIIDRDILKRTV